MCECGAVVTSWTDLRPESQEDTWVDAQCKRLQGESVQQEQRERQEQLQETGGGGSTGSRNLGNEPRPDPLKDLCIPVRRGSRPIQGEQHKVAGASKPPEEQRGSVGELGPDAEPPEEARPQTVAQAANPTLLAELCNSSRASSNSEDKESGGQQQPSSHWFKDHTAGGLTARSEVQTPREHDEVFSPLRPGSEHSELIVQRSPCSDMAPAKVDLEVTSRSLAESLRSRGGRRPAKVKQTRPRWLPLCSLWS